MKKKKAFLLAFKSGFICFSVYLLLGFAVLTPTLYEAGGAAEPVADKRYRGDTAILLCSDELSHYAALYADFENESLSLTLFESREAAEKHGFSYDRYINYTRSAQIDVIGWLGGIVIDNEICYNNKDYGLLKGERLFGVRATTLSLHDSELRAFYENKYAIPAVIRESDPAYESLKMRVSALRTIVKENGGRRIAVGTTSVRTLESVADEDGRISAKTGWTNIFIKPGYRFRAVDALITNFHLPESTLLMLVSAMCSREEILRVYQHAIEERYRFFSFGDAMLIL